MINKRDLINGGYAIFRDLLKYFSMNDERVVKSFYESIRELYLMGMISEEEFPDETSESDIAGIEINGKYIDITFYYESMMVEYLEVEEFIWEKWIQTRTGLLWYYHFKEFNFIKEDNFGIRIKGIIGVSGETHKNWFATVFTPEDIKNIYNKNE